MKEKVLKIRLKSNDRGQTAPFLCNNSYKLPEEALLFPVNYDSTPKEKTLPVSGKGQYLRTKPGL
jgi:hypothetical protein